MSDSTLLNSLPKIYFDRKKNRGISYVKAYDGNAWNADKGYAVKINTRTIGVIDSPDALGLIRFNKDFLELRPDFKDVAVVSYFDTDEGKHKLRIEHNLNANVVTKHFDSCSHDVTHVYSIGTYDVFMKLLEGDTLLKTLKESFADNWSELLSLAFYCLKDGDFTSNRYAMYAQSHKLPCQDPLTPTSITRLFQSISKEDELNFFTKYIEELYCAHELPTRRFWALDSTSISTYAKLADAKFGHNKQNEDIPQINVLMITDQKTGRPIFYNRFNGAIPDVSTVTSTFETLLHLEECFSDLKVKMCCDRFRVSCEDSLVGKCFVEFIALSLYMRMEMIIRKAMDKNKEVPHHSIKTIIEDLEEVTVIAFADSFVTIKPISKTQVLPQICCYLKIGSENCH